jgi:hypothetical protein
MTGKPEITEEQAGVAKRLQAGGLRAACFSQLSLSNLWDTIVAMWVCGAPERKAFSYNKRTMDRAMGPF